jgi:hypothetical protein
MADENMSAEEAAELVGPWHPEVDGRAACLLLPRLTSTVVNLHAKLGAERAGFDAFADLQRVKLESARAEIARLRRLALVPMAPGEVPTNPEEPPIEIKSNRLELSTYDDRLREQFTEFARRPLNLNEYWSAPSGEGPLGAEWDNKPHRLLYDLIGEVVRIQEMLTDEEERGDANA